MYRAQIGDFVHEKWRPGSFDEALSAPSMADAKTEIDKRLADGDGTGFEIGDTLRVIGNGEMAYRPLKFEDGDATWSESREAPGRRDRQRSSEV